MGKISKKTMILGLVVAAVSIGFVPILQAAPLPKVTICHNTPDEVPDKETIMVSQHALLKHEAKHGDTQGACAELCNDGFDNDDDGAIDCADSDCFSDINCFVGD